MEEALSSCSAPTRSLPYVFIYMYVDRLYQSQSWHDLDLKGGPAPGWNCQYNVCHTSTRYKYSKQPSTSRMCFYVSNQNDSQHDLSTQDDEKSRRDSTHTMCVLRTYELRVMQYTVYGWYAYSIVLLQRTVYGWFLYYVQSQGVSFVECMYAYLCTTRCLCCIRTSYSIVLYDTSILCIDVEGTRDCKLRNLVLGHIPHSRLIRIFIHTHKRKMTTSTGGDYQYKVADARYWRKAGGR